MQMYGINCHSDIVLRNRIYVSLSVNIVELCDFMAHLSFAMHPPPIKEIDCYEVLI